MYHDDSGAQIEIAGAEATRHWNAMTAAFLAHGRATPDHLGAVIAAAPDAALPLAVKGLFCVMLGRREMTVEAARAAAAGRRLLQDGPDCPRSRHFLDALDLWLAGNPPAAILALEAQLLACPTDTLAAKLVHGMRFMIGDAAGMLRSIERVMPAHGTDHPYRGYLLGCRAFGLEENGDYAAATASGMEGLALTSDDAWGLHAVTHVHDMTHRPDAGISLIESHPESWTHCNNFRYHVWWHKALLHLDRGETDRVLALYDDQIRADRSDDYRDISNATSLLMRLELEGADVGDRWDELAALSEARCEDGQLIFADLHYMLALMGGNHAEAAARLEGSIVHRSMASTPMGAIAADPGCAAVTGLAAFGEGRYNIAFPHLARAMDGLQRIGGSHAQRDVFERIAIDTGLRAGYLDATERLLRSRAAKRAGRIDSFAETRLARIASARQTDVPIPAQ